LVHDAKGLVDLCSGDRRCASFNARQPCDGHSRAAVGVLAEGEGDVSGCVVCGQAVCGDFGSSSVLRFMVLGGVASSLYPFERIAAEWHIKALADGEAYSSAFYSWEGELLGAAIMTKPKRGSAPLYLYNMASARPTAERGRSQEWMYELENIRESRYSDANAAKMTLIAKKLQNVGEGPKETRGDDVLVWRVAEVGLWRC